MTKQTTLCLALALSFTSMSHAMFMRPSLVPLDRIVKNTQAYVEEHPDDPEGFYTLGRCYYLGFFNKTTIIPAFEYGQEGKPPPIAPDWLLGNHEAAALNAEAEKRTLAVLGAKNVEDLSSEDQNRYYRLLAEHTRKLQEENWKPAALPYEQAMSYAMEARKNFEKAISMDGDNALYHLGLASLYEQVHDFLKVNTVATNAFSNVDSARILDAYWEAFELSVKEDAKLGYRPAAGLRSLVSYEAGNAWLRLNGSDEAKKEAIQQQLDTLGALKMGAITPLVITSDAVSRPEELVLKGQRVEFDLDGEGHAEAWEWITPDTGLLVWDPFDRRSITSGVQLFGNYTFQIIWSDGFRALAALDDNGDQRIDGKELEGLSVWYDRNSNGISEPNEVASVRERNIVSLAYGGEDRCDGVEVRKDGVTYADASTGHLWDWISHIGVALNKRAK